MKKSGESPNIEKHIELNCSVEHAFNTFTKKMSKWWPLKTHSCFGSKSLNVVIEERVNGRVIECSQTGETSFWGTVVEWAPPEKFSMTWHPSSPEEEATLVTVEFVKLGDKCQVNLVHSRWEKRKDPKVRDGYNSGWDSVLALFSKTANEVI